MSLKSIILNMFCGNFNHFSFIVWEVIYIQIKEKMYICLIEFQYPLIFLVIIYIFTNSVRDGKHITRIFFNVSKFYLDVISISYLLKSYVNLYEMSNWHQLKWQMPWNDFSLNNYLLKAMKWKGFNRASYQRKCVRLERISLYLFE